MYVFMDVLLLSLIILCVHSPVPPHATVRILNRLLAATDEFLLESLCSASLMEVLEGHENQKGLTPLLELAPYQRCFWVSGTRSDPLVGTMEKDPAYVSFLKSLNKDSTTCEEQVMSLDDWMDAKEAERALTKNNVLLEYLKEKRQQGGGKGGKVRGGAGAGKDKKTSQRKSGLIRPTTSISSSSTTPAASSGIDAGAATSSLPSGSKSKRKGKGKGIFLCFDSFHPSNVCCFAELLVGSQLLE